MAARELSIVKSHLFSPYTHPEEKKKKRQKEIFFSSVIALVNLPVDAQICLGYSNLRLFLDPLNSGQKWNLVKRASLIQLSVDLSLSLSTPLYSTPPPPIMVVNQGQLLLFCVLRE